MAPLQAQWQRIKRCGRLDGRISNILGRKLDRLDAYLKTVTAKKKAKGKKHGYKN